MVLTWLRDLVQQRQGHQTNQQDQEHRETIIDNHQYLTRVGGGRQKGTEDRKIGP